MKITAYNVVAGNAIYAQVDTKREATALRKELRTENPGMDFEIEAVR